MNELQQLQIDYPLFVRDFHKPVIWHGREYKYNSHFPWKELGVPYDTVKALFNSDQLYHNPDLEREHKVGDRLEELNATNIERLYLLVNAWIKKNTSTNTQYNNKKIKVSRIKDKQVGLIRAWVNQNQKWEDAQKEYLRIKADLIESQGLDKEEVEEA
jgi:hypothetical protein